MMKKALAAGLAGFVGLAAVTGDHGVGVDQPHGERGNTAPVLYRLTQVQPGTAAMTVHTAGSFCTWLPRTDEVIPIPALIAKGAPLFEAWQAASIFVYPRTV